MKFIASLFLAASLACASSHAATVTVKITGTVSSGSDTSGIFFPFAACSSRNPCNLAGQTFSLIYTFNDTLGQQYEASNISYIEQTPSSNPGTAVLTINSNSFEFAAPVGRLDVASSAQSDIPPGRYDEYSLGASDLGSSVAGHLYPANGHSFGNAADWRSPFTYLGPFYPGTALVANISEGSQHANNISLSPNALQVEASGVSECSTCPSSLNNVSVSNSFNLSSWHVVGQITDSGEFDIDTGEQIALVTSGGAALPTLLFEYTAFAYPLNANGSEETLVTAPDSLWLQPVPYSSRPVGALSTNQFVLQATFPSRAHKQHWKITIPPQQDAHGAFSFTAVDIYVPN